jgi:hypothetical protein
MTIEWRKSSRSNVDENSHCVEVAGLPSTIAVRDSKAPGAGNLEFGVSDWRAFVGAVKSGRLDVSPEV